MQTIIQLAKSGQRKAIAALYEQTRADALHVASCLLLQDSLAQKVCANVYQTIWNSEAMKRVTTQEEFSHIVLRQTAEQCRKITVGQNSKAFRLPADRSFSIVGRRIAAAAQEPYLTYVLSQLPPLQRYALVLRTAGRFDQRQLAEFLHTDERMAGFAADSEAANVNYLLQAAGIADTYSYDKLVQELKAPNSGDLAALDRQTAGAISAAGQQSDQARRRRIALTAALIGALCLCAIIIVLIAGSAKRDAQDMESTSLTQQTGDSEQAAGADQQVDLSQLSIDPEAAYDADIAIEGYGTVSVSLDAKAAPITVDNFVKLAREGFYNGLTFHRIVDGFMMQGGDPTGTGTGGSDQTIVGEFSANGYENNLSHTRGAISMARSNSYDSASSQFFIVQSDSTFLDGQYAAFGYVTDGMDIVDELCEQAGPEDRTLPADEQPVITSITIRESAAE